MNHCRLEIKNGKGYFVNHLGVGQVADRLWDLPDLSHVKTLYIDNVLQVMTSMEADLALLNYFNSLSIGAEISVIVPNLTYFMKMFDEADWNNVSLTDANSDARRAFRGIFGEQVNGNPRDLNYNAIDLSIFKSGYTKLRIKLMLERAGFTGVKVSLKSDDRLLATGKKTMLRGERQIASEIENIRPDHLNRYEFAAQKMKTKNISIILDCACGIGYGSKLLAESTKATIAGLDIDQAAIAQANKYFNHPRVEFSVADAKTFDFPKSKYDAVVSFETIEHIDFPDALLKQFYTALRKNGYLFCSTPNETVMPYSKEKFPFHHKHYTVEEFKHLLETAGFTELEIYKQDDPVTGKVISGSDGCFSIIVARK